MQMAEDAVELPSQVYAKVVQLANGQELTTTEGDNET